MQGKLLQKMKNRAIVYLKYNAIKNFLGKYQYKFTVMGIKENMDQNPSWNMLMEMVCFQDATLIYLRKSKTNLNFIYLMPKHADVKT